MKLQHVLCLCACIVSAGLARADQPPSGSTLATMQGTIDFCARMYPDTATSLEQFAKLLVKGFTEEELEKVRMSDEYTATYAQVDKDLRKTHSDAAKEACHGMLGRRP